MAKSKELKIVVTLEDQVTKGFKKIESATNSFASKIKKATLASAAFAGGTVLGLKSVVTAASDFEKSIIGLESVAKSFGIETKEVTKAANELIDDGLLKMTDAAAGLKNLLATGFSLPQAIDLMNAFKDSAAFNRQGTLAFGAAIVGATQGLKNQNSIMVDNAGITKNLSNILKEAGISANELGSVTSDVTVRTALYNGILKEASMFTGDAALSTETYQGKITQLDKATTDLRIAIGETLLPVLAKLIDEHLIPLAKKSEEVINFFKDHQTATLILAGAIIGALIPAVISLTVAFATLALTLAPFVIAGGLIAAIVGFINFLSKSGTGFTLLEQLQAAFTLLGNIIGGVIQKLDTFFSKISKGIQESKFGKGANKLAESALKEIGFLARGGTAQAGKPFVVGENGPELFVPGRTGTVIPNKAFSNSSGNGEVTVNFNAPIGIRKDSDIQAIVNAVKFAISREDSLFAQGVL